jgi:hypothetical protein
MLNKICSKCKVFPATAKHPWCLECRAENQAANREAKDTLAHTKGYGEGVEAMRETLAVEFERLGTAVVTCLEVSKAIRVSPRPNLRLDAGYNVVLPRRQFHGS